MHALSLSIQCHSFAVICAILCAATVALLPTDSAWAAPLPPGEFVDAQTIEEDSALLCSFYLHKKKTSAYLSRIDGERLYKKNFWTVATLRKKIKDLSKTIKGLNPKSSKLSKKKWKRAKKDRKNFQDAKRQLQTCVAQGAAQGGGSAVRFEHVESLIQKQCMNCHGALGWENTEAFFRESGRVVAGNLEASPFYTFLSNNPEGYQPAYMPKGLPALPDMNLVLLGRWILEMDNGGAPSPTPTPGGAEGEGRNLYNQFCSACHGTIDNSAKWGKSAAQIAAAMQSVPQMLHLNLTSDQIQKIALALANVQPPEEGTLAVTSLGASLEGNPGGPVQKLRFRVTFTGAASQPFTVGYVTTNGSALADSDFEFAVGTLQFQGTNGESKIVEVEIIGDSFQEANETMFLDIGGVSYGGVRVTTSTAMGTITNDDSLDQNPPPAAAQVRLAYGFNGDYKDAIGLADGIPQGTLDISTDARIGSGALALDDASDYLSVPGTNLGNLSNFTLAAWVFWTNSSAVSSRIFDFGASTNNYIMFTPRDSGNRCRFELRAGNGITYLLQCPTGMMMPAGQWVHLAVSFNAASDEMRIYFNGQEVAYRNGVLTDPSTFTLTDNRIGRARVSVPEFEGRVDEMLVWNAALDPDDIVESMNMSESASFNSGLEVRLNGQVIPNGSILNFGTLETGESLSHALFVQNNGPAGLQFLSAPNVSLAGANADSFSIKVQPMPWQQLLGVGSMTSFVLRYEPRLAGSKNATLQVSNSDLLHGNYAVGLMGAATGDPIADPEPSGGGSGGSSEGETLYAINCASCHGALATSQKRGATIQQVTAALSSIPQMSQLVLSQDQLEAIVIALNTPVAQPDDTPVVGDAIINIGTAPYVVSVLKDIFLPPDPATYTAQDTTVWTHISEGVLGERLNGTFISGRAVYFSRRRQRFDTKFQGEELNNLLRPVPDTIRSGLLNRVCDLVTDQDRAVTNALGKVNLSTSDAVTPARVKSVYEQLFAPGKTLPQYMAETISTFPSNAPNFTSTDNWRFVLNYFCTSSVTEGI